MNSIRVELPLPPQVLSPNKRPHWRTKAAAVSQYRGVAKIAAMIAVGTDRKAFEAAQFPWGCATAQVHWFHAGIQPDRDNVLSSLKSAFDGIADSGVIGNDRELIHLPVQFYKVSKDEQGVIITVTKSDGHVCPTCGQSTEGGLHG
jgi:Holliday junction resolvase RusA-like endonuclease